MPKRQPPGPTPPTPSRNLQNLWLSISLLLLAGVAAAAWWWTQPVIRAPSAAPAPAHWVAENSCQGCHTAQFQDWQKSHHRLAMQVASSQTVQGDFTAPPLRNEVDSISFLQKGDEFWVNTTGADGKTADFKVAYTFGFEPLQQYLVELPGGRLQALPAAWDVEKKAWFHLYPEQGIDYHDPLHWSGAQQNANFMCIECHTTGYQRRFDPAKQVFDSHWQALGVGCQACHGPASNHLQWARQEPPANTAGYGFEVSLREAGNQREVQTCARCHSRRAALDDGYQHKHTLLDDYRPSTLSPVLNEIDGKIKEEVFEYGSFVQSRMHAAGVRCSDCHNPHSGQLRISGNGVCSQCHHPGGTVIRAEIQVGGLKAADYDSPEHHGHPQGSTGAQCTSCHMPGKFYMVNDFRHDHSFSVPNPAQALELQHTDACLGCHRDKAPEQVVEQFKAWYPQASARDGGYALALHKARKGLPGAGEALLTQLARPDLPAIRKATLLAELPAYPSPLAQQAVLRLLQHPAPAVRIASLEVLPDLASPQLQAQALAVLLRDPTRAVRLAAAWQLVQLPVEFHQGLASWPAAIAEYEQAQESQRDRAEALVNLAMLYQLSNRTAQVEPTLRAAVQRDPHFHPATVLLAQWREQQGASTEALQMLRDNSARYPKEASYPHALGLTLVRQGQHTQALEALRKAHQLQPDNHDYLYVLAIALHDTGQPAEAIALLHQQVEAHPEQRRLRLALIDYLLQAGQSQQARELVEQLGQLNPGDPSFAQQARR
ncbi:tetratricopeptide repeat protein [Pseudomonas sp. DB1]|uniref:Tetratricopeptide repeat protein n=2 Tax=Metapseudomonas boanensis TaxID=2822138 RepID=A0ABS5XK04_9GAMM|nr:tetratricopeptide repeat protein [Pseudomonas boanensis]MBT8768034.1 tetratricopeptide repeat protein [Pseudomonas boanensis]